MEAMGTSDVVLPPQVKEFIYGMDHTMNAINASGPFIRLMKILEPLVLKTEADISIEEEADNKNQTTYRALETLMGKTGAATSFVTMMEQELAYLEDLTDGLSSVKEHELSPSEVEQQTEQKLQDNIFTNLFMPSIPVIGYIPMPMPRLQDLENASVESVSEHFNQLLENDGQGFRQLAGNFATGAINYATNGKGYYIGLAIKGLDRLNQITTLQNDEPSISTTQLSIGNKLLPAMIGGKSDGYTQWLAQKFLGMKKQDSSSEGPQYNLKDILDSMLDKFIADGKANITLQFWYDTLAFRLGSCCHVVSWFICRFHFLLNQALLLFESKVPHQLAFLGLNFSFPKSIVNYFDHLKFLLSLQTFGGLFPFRQHEQLLDQVGN